jgi:uncharacterized protein YcnI
MHTASWQRRAVITCVIWGFLMSLAATTWGHSDLDPRQSIPNKWETYTLNVPTETEVSTVQVHLLVPREFEIEMLEHSPVWQITKTRDERGYIREVTWSGSSIPPQTFAEFKLLVRNPATPGTYIWKIEQHYQDSTAATWEAQTQIVSPATVGGAQRAEEAWRAAQVATTISLVAIGIAVTLIIVTVLGILQGHRGRAQEHQ